MYKTINYIKKNYYQSIVGFKNQNEIIIDEQLVNFLDAFLIVYGTSIENNKLFMKEKFNIYQNPPFYIAITKEVFIPSKSINNDDCVLLNYQEILNFEILSNGLVGIIFKDQSNLTIKCSKHILEKQIARIYPIINHFSENAFDRYFYDKLESVA